MPLEILGSLVVFGILGIAILLHLLGNSEKLILQDADHVMEIWRANHPDITLDNVQLSDSRHQALVQGGSTTGLIWAMGKDATCRIIEPPLKLRKRGSGLIVSLPDFTAPRVRLDLSDPAKTATWTAILQGTSHG